VYGRATVAEALRLLEGGLHPREVADQLGVSDRTVRAWRAGEVPAHSRPDAKPGCAGCGGEQHNFAGLRQAYVYLLGLYLGDGTISNAPRDVYRLRIFLDLKYPGIVKECVAALAEVFPRNRIGRQIRGGNYLESSERSNIELSVYSKSMPCLFPQHGPGKKHQRRIWLAEWQWELAQRWPEALVRGLIQSDGCRFINTGRGGWRHPRYLFSNLSSDITSIYSSACECLGLRWTAVFPEDENRAIRIYVSRKDDVARMDEFAGPKA
jgi:Homeodomain-like domain